MKVTVSFEATDNEQLVKLREIMDQAANVLAGSTLTPAPVANTPDVPPPMVAPPATVAQAVPQILPPELATGTPVISAPIAPAEPAVTDGAGVPWNADYHAGTKTQTKAGKWKRRKGMSAEEKAASDAYEAGYTAPAAPATPTVGIVNTPVTQPVPTTMPTPTPAAPVMPGMTIPADPTNPFAIINRKINKIVAEGLTPGPNGSMLAEKGVDLTASPDVVIDGLLRAYDVEGFGALQDHPDKWANIIQAVDLIWP